MSLLSCPVTVNPCEENSPIFSRGTFWFPEVSAELSSPLAQSCACQYHVLCSVVSDTSQDTQRNSGYMGPMKGNVGKSSFCKVNRIVHLEDPRITAGSGRPFYP